MAQYTALHQFSDEYARSKTVGQAKKALIDMGLDFTSFETLTRSALAFKQSLGNHPSRCLVAADLEKLIQDACEIPDLQKWEDWGLRYFEQNK